MKKNILNFSVLLFPLFGYSNNYELRFLTNEDQYVDFYFLAICYKQVVYQYENSRGEYVYSLMGPRTAVQCVEGQTPGSTKTVYEVKKYKSTDVSE